MNNFTLLETILILYIVAINVLGVIAILLAGYTSRKFGEAMFFILLVVAIPVSLPIVLYELTSDKLKRRKRKQDLEKEITDFVKEEEK